MNGFEKEMRERIIGASSHATVTGLNEPIEDWQRLADLAIEIPMSSGLHPT